MSEKKRLAGWQFGVLLGVLILFICTMFIPLFRWNDKVVDKYIEFTTEIVTQNPEEFVYDSLENINSEAFKKELNDYFKYYTYADSTIKSVNAVYIMTHSFSQYWFGKSNLDSEKVQNFLDDDKFFESYSPKKISDNWNTFRILLIVIYVLGLVVIIMTILGFCLKWPNVVPAIINTIYGLLGLVMFLIYRITIGNGLSQFIIKDFVEIDKDYGKNWASPLFSSGFIIAIIVAAILLVFSIICMFVGKRAYNVLTPPERFTPPEPPQPIIPPTPVIPPQPIVPPTPVTPPQPVVPPTPVTPPQPVFPIQPPPQSVGRVKCTKGDAVGQGFKLPESKKVIVGKSPTKANLVINNKNVSNVHCSIRYNAAHNSYIIKDHSTNGTYANGVKLPIDQPVEYPAGTVLSLADGTNQITLG